MEKTFNLDYAKYYDLFNEGKNYENEATFLKNIFDSYGTGVKTILNLGCGTGMHEIFLSKFGYNVTGVDLSEEMIKIAKGRNIPNTKFHVGNMSKFELNKKFDACVSMFAAFGYQLKNKEIESSLKSIKEHLNPNGLAVIEVWNGLGVMRELPSSRKKEISAGGFKIKRQSFPDLDAFNHKAGIKFKVEVYKNDALHEKYEEMHYMRFFFPQEITYYLEKEGFEVLKICDTFDLNSKVDEKNWNMVVIGKLK